MRRESEVDLAEQRPPPGPPKRQAESYKRKKRKWAAYDKLSAAAKSMGMSLKEYKQRYGKKVPENDDDDDAQYEADQDGEHDEPER